MTNTSHPSLAAAIIAKLAPGFKPRVGIILGSGLGHVADQIKNPIVIPYADLPGFPISTVVGHAGRMILGELSGVSVACLQGRAHPYEGISGNAVKTLIRTLRLIGCEMLFITNAAGSLRKEVEVGRLMMITDHINFQPRNPLVGPNDDEFGPRFVPLENAYDLDLRAQLQAAAAKTKINLADGVYMSVLGPCFETPAEIRAFRVLGADAIGMSTVPEVLVARHCDLRVVAVSVITNFAVGMFNEKHGHEQTLRAAQAAARDLATLLEAFLQNLTSAAQTQHATSYAAT